MIYTADEYDSKLKFLRYNTSFRKFVFSKLLVPSISKFLMLKNRDMLNYALDTDIFVIYDYLIGALENSSEEEILEKFPKDNKMRKLAATKLYNYLADNLQIEHDDQYRFTICIDLKNLFRALGIGPNDYADNANNICNALNIIIGIVTNIL